MFHHNNKINNIKEIFSKKVKQMINKNNSIDLNNINFYDKKILYYKISNKTNDLIKTISNSLYSYNKKNIKNISLYNQYRDNYEKLSKLYKYLKKDKFIENNERKSLLELIYNYNTKKKFNLDIDKIKKSEIFKNSSLIDSNVKRLKSFYILNYGSLLKEAKKNEMLFYNIKSNNSKIKVITENINNNSDRNEFKENAEIYNNYKISKDNRNSSSKNNNSKNIQNKSFISKENNSKTIHNNSLNTKHNSVKYSDNKLKQFNYNQDRNNSDILNIEQINNLKDIKFLNKMNIITQIKIERLKTTISNNYKNLKNTEDNSLYYKNLMEKIKEIERKGILTERRKI